MLKALPADRPAFDLAEGLLVGKGHGAAAKALPWLVDWLTHTIGETWSARLFALIMARIVEAGRAAAWDPDALVADVEEGLRAAGEEVPESLVKQLTYLHDVLSGEELLKSAALSKGDPVIMALLVTLTDSEPEHILDGLRTHGVDAVPVILTAAFFGGYIRGLAALDAAYKPLATSSALLRAAAGWLGVELAGLKPLSPQTCIVREERTDRRTSIYSLLSSGTVLASAETARPALRAVLNAAALRDGALEAMAIQLAIERGWDDCAYVEIIVDHFEVAMRKGRGGGVVLRLPAGVLPKRCLDAKAFIARASSEEEADAPDMLMLRDAILGASAR